jgi:hypothetical protein
MFNAHYEPLTFTLPVSGEGNTWLKILDTHEGIPIRARVRNGPQAMLPPDEQERLQELYNY